MKYTTKYIAYTAILVAINVLINALPLPYVPGSGTKFSLTYLPTFLAGFYFGPGGGFLVGALGDVFGWLINSSDGAWSPLITLTSGLMGAIPGFVRYIPVKEKWTIVISYLATFLIVSATLNSLITWFFFYAGNKTFLAFLSFRVLIQAIVMMTNLVLNILLMPVFDKIIGTRVKSLKDQRLKALGYAKEQEDDVANDDLIQKTHD